MISRLTIFAATFAVLATALLIFIVTPRVAAASTDVDKSQVRVVQLDRMVITAKRVAGGF